MFFYFIQLMFGDACVSGQFYLWLQPVLGLMAATEHMDVHPFLLIGVYLECVFALEFEYRTHNLLQFCYKITNSF